MNILLFGIIAIAFASTVTQRNGAKALGQGVFYSLNMSSFYNGSSMNLEWNMLKSIIHPKTIADVIFEAYKSRVNKLMKNRDTYIYLPALIGMILAFLIILLIIFLKFIFKRLHLLRLIEIKQTNKQPDDKAVLIQNKNLDDNMDTILV
ncbi:unnamed protein product [Cercopithifilaria johnstoni]|uniref:Uncharacterized protein n=1 Tax=Cercopithifilaria johnstoni TaxID=2874296 RepID=A0A8J2M356_9BILA|nr:unnamed protein product [Cercopithifilaria johnstoni]